MAVRVGPPIDYKAPAWRIYEGGSLLLEIPFRFDSAEGSAAPPEFLRGARAEKGSFLSSDWRVSAPDRNDGFSIRWLGYWTPGEADCDMRLTADESATFYLDGMKALACVAGTTRSEGTFAFDSRPHELRVDYGDRSGEAFVKLEARGEEGDWKPVVAETERKKGGAVGWNAEYYLGENSEQKAFSRIDPTIDFEWGEKSPFDRAEDTPTLTWRIVNLPDSRCCGEISANRAGTLVLDCVLPATVSARNASLSFTNPLIEFSGAQTGQTVAIQFDRETANFEVGQSTQTDKGLSLGRLEFSLRAGDSIRFWEKGGALETGAQVAQAVGDSELAYENSRPRLGEEWGRWDEPTIRNGAWFLQVLCDGAIPSGIETEERIRLARAVAPDLISALEGLSPTPAGAPRLVTERLHAALEGLKAIESRLRENSQGRLDLLFGENAGGEYRVDRWPFGSGRFVIQCDANGFRIAESSGTFWEFDAPGTIKGFQVDAAGAWSGEVDLNHATVLRGGPAERVSGMLWNETPLTLLREGDHVQARAPSAKGNLRLLLKRAP